MVPPDLLEKPFLCGFFNLELFLVQISLFFAATIDLFLDKNFIRDWNLSFYPFFIDL